MQMLRSKVQCSLRRNINLKNKTANGRESKKKSSQLFSLANFFLSPSTFSLSLSTLSILRGTNVHRLIVGYGLLVSQKKRILMNRSNFQHY